MSAVNLDYLAGTLQYPQLDGLRIHCSDFTTMNHSLSVGQRLGSAQTISGPEPACVISLSLVGVCIVITATHKTIGVAQSARWLYILARATHERQGMCPEAYTINVQRGYTSRALKH